MLGSVGRDSVTSALTWRLHGTESRCRFTPRDGLNFPAVKRLAEPSALVAAYGLSWAHCL